MSLFRKPKKRMQMRVFANDDDDDLNGNSGNSMDVDDGIIGQSPTLSIRPKKDKVKEKFKPKQALLSFGDEVEDDADAFKIKKSTQSKRLKKLLNKERERVKTDDLPNSVDLQPPKPPSLADNEETQTAAIDKTKAAIVEPGNPPAANFNSRNNDGSYPKEGLILSGRFALAAGRSGDVSDSEGDDEERSENGDKADGVINQRFRAPTFRPSGRSVRALLDSGAIPDAAVIHAARKRRQQVRETGDSIPLQQSQHHHPAQTKASIARDEPTVESKRREGRLVREDGAGDGSDEDPDRIIVKGVDHQGRREMIRLAAAQGTQGSDPDSGGEEWEAQQIRKAVTHTQIMAAQQENYYGSAYPMPIHQVAEMDLNPFAVITSSMPLAAVSSDHLRPLASAMKTPMTSQELVDTLKERLKALEESKKTRTIELSSMESELISLIEKRESSVKKAPVAASRYEFYQKLRGYLTDLIECLDEKMPSLVALEARAMALQRRKSAYLCERRRADVRDQAQETLKPNNVTKKDKEVRDEERSRRCAEREGRRLRRRRAREKEAGGQQHRDGDSSDEEVPQLELVGYQSTQEQILSDAGLLFSDTLEEFSSLASVLARLESWKENDAPAYVEAYAGLCLPKLAGPYLRLKLLLWNPITDEEAPDWEKMQWYRGLMLYGLNEDIGNPETEQILGEDPDIYLIPKIVQKVILPKLTDLVEATWDPTSGSQSRRLAGLVRRAGTLPGMGPGDPAFISLAETVLKRTKLALQHDVFIPILPKSVMESGGRNGAAFLRRQANAGSRLLANICALQGTIADSALAPLALSQLLQRYLIAAVRCCPPVFGAELCWVIVCSLPRVWLQQEKPLQALQQFLICCKEVMASLHSDNPLHLKPLEQIRSAILNLQGSSAAQEDK